uniref:WAS/WASL-interacting protein family member 3-like n=1 Tax=Nyctereutes procyonoides TaxID=34880 RepID=UPI0024449B79|nr:WAS/WASL-interacting protein family member 3-like [Nyctereutes procyonoides]
MSEPQECSSRESASGRRTRAGATCGQSRARFLRAAPPGQPARDGASPAPAARPGRPEARAQGGQGGLGAQGSPNCSKWQQREPAVPLTYPARLGQLAAGARALGRHKGTMEKLFSARADGGAQGPRLGASAQRGSAARRGQAAAPGSRPPPLPRREPFPRVSKKCQVLRGPHPAREPSPPPPLLPRLPASPAAALPGRPSASCVRLRRAGLRRRGARGPSASSAPGRPGTAARRPPPASARSFVLFPPTTCLNRGGGRPGRGRASRRVSPPASEGRSGPGERSARLPPPALPPPALAPPALAPSSPRPALSSFVASALGHDPARAISPPPPPLGSLRCGRTASALSDANLSTHPAITDCSGRRHRGSFVQWVLEPVCILHEPAALFKSHMGPHLHLVSLEWVMESAAVIELCCLSTWRRPRATHQRQNTLSIAASLSVPLAGTLLLHSAGEPHFPTHVTLQPNPSSVKTQPREHSLA